MKSYDKIPVNQDLLLDLQFSEGTGIVTTDRANNRKYPVDLKNTPTWNTITSGLGVLSFDSASNEYAEIDSLDSVDLDFTSGDYSVGCWWNRTYTAFTDILIAKYELSVSGWEIYVTDMTPAITDDYLTLRHHHAGGPSLRSACYSLGWSPSIWWFMGISRDGAWPQMYRNGEAVDTYYGPVGVYNPESAAAKDVVIGTRYTKNTNFWNGSIWGMRIWDRCLEASEWAELFRKERDFFGV